MKILFSILLLFPSIIYSQNIIWDKTLGGDRVDSVKEMLALSDGSFLVAGTSNSDSSYEKTANHFGTTNLPTGSPSPTDIWVLKLNPFGNIIWEKTFGGDLRDEVFGLGELSDSSIVLVAGSFSDISGNKSSARLGQARDSDIWYLRLDKNGNKIHDRTYGVPSDDMFMNIMFYQEDNWGRCFVDSADNTVVLSHSRGVNGLYINMFVIDSAGTLVYNKYVGDGLFQNAAETKSGFLIVAKSLNGIGNNPNFKVENGGWIFEIDHSGSILWESTLKIGNSNSLLDTNRNRAFVRGILVRDSTYILAYHTSSFYGNDKSNPLDTSYQNVAAELQGSLWLVEVDKRGQKLWDLNIPLSFFQGAYYHSHFSSVRIFEGANNTFEVFTSCYKQDNNNVLFPANLDKGESHILSFKFDSTGIVGNPVSVGSNGGDCLEDVIKVGNQYIVGMSTNGGNSFDKSQAKRGNNPWIGNTDYWLARMSIDTNKIVIPRIVDTTICKGLSYQVGTSTYTRTGTYIDTISQGNNLSIVQTTNLTVDTLNSDIVQLDHVSFIASEPNAQYQWYDCDADTIMTGDTSRNFTAPHNAFFGLIITKNGCVDTSFCALISAVGLETNQGHALKIYPNPAQDQLNVKWEGQRIDDLQIINLQGQIILRVSDEFESIDLSSISPGSFMVRVSNEFGDSQIIRFVKH
jgi:hypothetical protein